MTSSLTIKIGNEVNRDFILGLINECRCNFVEKWVNKYNSYIMYDYKPFESGEFDCTITVQGETEMIKYIWYLITKRIQEVEQLNKVFELQAV